MLDWLLCALVRAIGWVVCHLPPAFCVRLGLGLGWLASWLQPKRASIGYVNLKAAFGDRLPAALNVNQRGGAQAGLTPSQARRMVRRVFGQLGAGLVEMLRLPAINQAYLNRYIEMTGYLHFEEAVSSKRPVVFVTGHFGNWELCSITAALKGYPIVALARAQATLPKLYRLLVSYRESKGCRVVHKGGAMKQLLQALDRREPIGIVGDQASRQGIAVDFFGRPALFATGPFELARRSAALIVPAFIHRLRGPFHRIVVEPPIELPRRGKRDAVIRDGVEQFARVLARHIEQDPTQWLWLHKRWKHTPTRQVLVLSDGKLGHLKQSLAVVQALREHVADLREAVVEVRYRSPLARAMAVLWAWLIPRGVGALRILQLTLEPSCYAKLACRYADVIISCGASTAPVNVLLTADNRAKSVVIMNPTPIPLRKFSLAIVPVHDGVPRRSNVLSTHGALTAMSDGQMTEARERLQTHPRFRGSVTSGKPAIALFIGGDTPDYHVTTSFAEALLRHVLAVCEEADGTCLVTTSRRTPPDVERILAERLTKHPRCALLLLASRDQLNGTIEGMLGWAQVVVVTGESISMISEACASGRYVVAIEPPLWKTNQTRMTKPQRYLRLLTEQGYLRVHPMPEVSHAIRRLLTTRPPIRRLDSSAAVRDAVKRLL